MNYININTQETVIPSRIGNRDNVTWENSLDLLIGLGWRIQPVLPLVMEGFERLSITYIDGYDNIATAIYTDTLIQDRLDKEEAERIAAEEQRQLNKSLALKQTENAFLLLCEQLIGSKTKQGFDELNTVIKQLMSTNPSLAIQLSIELLSVDAAGKRCGGLLWWDDVIWHQEII